MDRFHSPGTRLLAGGRLAGGGVQGKGLADQGLPLCPQDAQKRAARVGFCLRTRNLRAKGELMVDLGFLSLSRSSPGTLTRTWLLVPMVTWDEKARRLGKESGGGGWERAKKNGPGVDPSKSASVPLLLLACFAVSLGFCSFLVGS